MITITLQVNGMVMRKVEIHNLHPNIFPTKIDDECPFQVKDDLTQRDYFVVHNRSDGDAELVRKVFERISEHETELRFTGG